MTSDFSDFWVHTVTVETLTGSGADGAIFDTATDVPCFIEDSQKVVRASDGTEVVSGTTLFADKVWAPKFTPSTRVTFRGQTTLVLTTKLHDSGALNLPDHLEVMLQ